MSVSASIIFCDTVIMNVVNGKQTPTISRPLKKITPFAIPGNYSFSIFCSIENAYSDVSHKIRIRVENTDDKIIFDTSEILIDCIKPGTIPLPSIEITADLRNIVIETPGKIKAHIEYDGDDIVTEKLEVLSNN